MVWLFYQKLVCSTKWVRYAGALKWQPLEPRYSPVFFLPWYPKAALCLATPAVQGNNQFLRKNISARSHIIQTFLTGLNLHCICHKKMPLKCPHSYLWIISIFPGISLHYHRAASYWNTTLTRFIWKFPDNNDWGITGPPKAKIFLEMHYKSRIFNAFEQSQKLMKLYLRKNCAPALLHHKQNKTVPEVQPVRLFFLESYKLINFIAKKFLFPELCTVTQN